MTNKLEHPAESAAESARATATTADPDLAALLAHCEVRAARTMGERSAEWTRRAAALRTLAARMATAERLAYVDPEHRFPDSTYKARAEELLADLRTARAEADALRAYRDAVMDGNAVKAEARGRVAARDVANVLDAVARVARRNATPTPPARGPEGAP